MTQAELTELLAGYVLGDLSPEEESQLKEVWSDETSDQLQSLELSASAVELMLLKQDESEIPVWLRDKIQSDAPQHLTRSQSGVEATISQNASDQAPPSRRGIFAWLAVAASLLVAIGSWMTRSGPGDVAQDLVRQRTDLITDGGDLIRLSWQPGKTPFDSEVTGDVIWSTQQQEGYMRFVGMKVNDPSVEQYQLWIIDPARDDEPVDGGVFDITDQGEVIIPIDAKLAVVDPRAFAITIESPVVSLFLPKNVCRSSLP